MKHFIKELRNATGLKQKAFAERYGIPLSTLRKWEQGDSFPSDYVVNLIELTIPSFNKEYKVVRGDTDDDVFYIDEANSRVSDKIGNWVSFTEDINGVIERNLPVYFKDLFDDFYIIQKRLNRSLKYDKIEKIEWR